LRPKFLVTDGRYISTHVAQLAVFTYQEVNRRRYWLLIDSNRIEHVQFWSSKGTWELGRVSQAKSIYLIECETKNYIDLISPRTGQNFELKVKLWRITLLRSSIFSIYRFFAKQKSKRMARNDGEGMGG
jgi:hypothetical protein